jgi:antitoxin HicB
VFLRFHADMTEREIGHELGISQAQVSRLLDRALARLRKALEDKDFSPGTGDTTEKRVVSGAEDPKEGLPDPSTQENHQPFEAPETRIAAVGAADEQARSGRPRDGSPKEDLAMPYHVTVKPAGDGRSSWIASLDELPGCEAHGETQDQAVENLRSSMEGWLSAAVDEPRVISPPRSASKRKKASSHSGRFLVRMPSTLHEELTKAAEREQVSLNRFVTAQLEASVGSTGGGAQTSVPVPVGESTAPPSGHRRRLRFLFAANVAIIVLAGAAAVALLVLALQRGI